MSEIKEEENYEKSDSDSSLEQDYFEDEQEEKPSKSQKKAAQQPN